MNKETRRWLLLVAAFIAVWTMPIWYDGMGETLARGLGWIR